MKVKELRELLQSAKDDDEVVIDVVTRGHLGGGACVGISQAYSGNDWDDRTFRLMGQHQLTELTLEDVKAIHKSLGQAQSYHTMQMIRRMRENMQETLDGLPTECPNCGFSLTGNE